ncbi:MAG: hypothetical protein IPK26_12195 [Planctomycetes bacterium]|nr:hypothetical protein [Planctomycetota bacterium]
MTSLPRSALSLCLLSALAAQSDADRAELATQFQRLDADKSGSVSRKEFPGSDRQFAAMDRDRDGKASLAEYAESAVARAFLRTRQRERGEPRARTSLEALAALRLQVLLREDPDGKIDQATWIGAADAFATLDLDGNGVLDRRDRIEAVAGTPAPRPELPPWREVPAITALFEALDKNGDQRIDDKEARPHKQLPAAFPFADQDRDHALDRQELEALLQVLAARAAAEQARERRPQAFDVPFAEWDKDKDGKVQQNEWQNSRALFERIDLDRDAAVTHDEAERYERRVEGRDFVERYDLDGDGRVTRAEFAGPQAAFARADRNGDGVITRSER